MVKINDILLYASDKPSVSVASVAEHFASLGEKCTLNAISCKFRRLVNSGVLQKVGWGKFAVAGDAQGQFAPYSDEEMSEIEKPLRREYPFMDNICVWNLLDIKKLSHYVSRLDYIYVEVDRDAVEGVFEKLTASEANKPNGRRVFITPTADECYHYTSNGPAVIVKPLVTEAPVIKYADGTTRASLEKILVDAAVDPDLDPWHDYESYRLYDAAFDRYKVNTAKMLRYAQRRGKKEEISEIINNRKSIYD
ncbi:MAG: hypothetical protein LIP02_07965 [Bacteroidales bacterium]|nr:hypothetical protein [Bacteroidales bacterium]